MKDINKPVSTYKTPEIHLRFKTQELYLGFLELAEKVNQGSKKKWSHNALLNALVAKELSTPSQNAIQDRWEKILVESRKKI